MKNSPLRTLILSLQGVAALSLVVACSDDSTGANGTGGGNGSGSGDFSTGVSGDKPLSDLTPAEVEQLCDDLDAYYTNSSVTSDLQELSCRFAGLFGAAFAGAESDEAVQAVCQMAYDSCQAEPSESTWECGPASGECTATVSELMACTKDSAEGLNQAKEQFPECSELTLDDLEAAPSAEGAEPTSCTTFQMKCPGGPLPPIPTM
jgi:hypothetical protein